MNADEWFFFGALFIGIGFMIGAFAALLGFQEDAKMEQQHVETVVTAFGSETVPMVVWAMLGVAALLVAGVWVWRRWR